LLAYSGLPLTPYGLTYGAATIPTIPAIAGYAGHNAAGLPTLKAAPCVNADGAPTECAGYNYAYAPCAGARIIAKREAESDPAYLTAGAYGLPYAGAYGLRYAGAYSSVLPYAYNYGVAGFAGFDGLGRPAIKSAPCTNVYGLPVSC